MTKCEGMKYFREREKQNSEKKNSAPDKRVVL